MRTFNKSFLSLYVNLFLLNVNLFMCLTMCVYIFYDIYNYFFTIIMHICKIAIYQKKKNTWQHSDLTIIYFNLSAENYVGLLY